MSVHENTLQGLQDCLSYVKGDKSRVRENGSGNYTEERESLHSDVTIGDIVSRIKSKQNAEQ